MTLVVMCMGGRQGYPAGCGTLSRPSKALQAQIRHADRDSEGYPDVEPGQCPECGSDRVVEYMTPAQISRELYG